MGIGAIGVLLCSVAACGAASDGYRLGEDGALTFAVGAVGAFPETLLTYPVHIDRAGVVAEQLQLVDLGTSNRAPLQLSAVRRDADGIRFARVSFLAGTDGKPRAFRLSSDAAGRPVSPPAPLARAAEDARAVVLDNGVLCVRLPAGGAPGGGMPAPGPLLGVRATGADERWIGHSTLESPALPVTALRTSILADGPLFAAAEAVYTFARGAAVRVTVRLAHGQSHAYVEEQVEGLSPEDGVHIETAWTGFSPTHRAFPTDRSVVEGPMLLPLDVPGMPHGEDPRRAMAYPVLPGLPYTERGLYAAFKDVNTGRYVGLFRTLPPPADNAFGAPPGIAFRVEAGELIWRWPLASGRRSTAVCMGFDRSRDIWRPVAGLARDYGARSLDRAKDWQVRYPPEARRPAALFPGGPLHDPAAVLLHDITGRNAYFRLLAGYNRSSPFLAPEARRRIDAHVLRNVQACADAPFPGFRAPGLPSVDRLADHEVLLPAGAFLFPEHPAATAWSDRFHKFVETSLALHTTRPDPAVGARGGRWSGNLSHDLWTFLRPLSWGAFAAAEFDGRNPVANPWAARLADWVVGNLSAPVNGRRLLPPRGRGGGGTGLAPPAELRALGHGLRRYRPMTAEHLLWAAPPGTQPFGRPAPGWRRAYGVAESPAGTPPRLESAAFAGDGFVLRAAVGTPEEVSLHLVQLAPGPTTGQGAPAEGGCGMIFYYAAGEAFSGHAYDAAGERAGGDVDGLTNCGVLTDAGYRAIGRNRLVRPLRDVETAQLAALLPRRGPDAYAWPAYRGRSVLLVGADYFVVHDAVAPDTPSRFTWAAPPQGRFPFIHMLCGEQGRLAPGAAPGVPVYRCDRDRGDSLALVSHRRDLSVDPESYGCKVDLEDGLDLVFRGAEPIRVRGWRYRFEGRTGVIRKRRRGRQELALFGAGTISDGAVTIETQATNAAFSMAYRELPECGGWSHADEPVTVRLELRERVPPRATFSVDGVSAPLRRGGDEAVLLPLPAGRRRWQITAGFPRPARPEIVRVEHQADGGALHYTAPPRATTCRIEISRDGCRTWTLLHVDAFQPDAAESAASYALPVLPNGVRVHVRVMAAGPDGSSDPSAPVPVDITRDPPPPPDGLQCRLGDDRVTLSWGEVLGATAYQLYRRPAGNPDAPWRCIFRGPAYRFEDGAAADPRRGGPVYAYAVAAVNGNGEGPPSPPVTTEPQRWIHRYPR